MFKLVLLASAITVSQGASATIVRRAQRFAAVSESAVVRMYPLASSGSQSAVVRRRPPARSSQSAGPTTSVYRTTKNVTDDGTSRLPFDRLDASWGLQPLTRPFSSFERECSEERVEAIAWKGAGSPDYKKGNIWTQCGHMGFKHVSDETEFKNHWLGLSSPGAMPTLWDYAYGPGGPSRLAPCTVEAGCKALLKHIGDAFPQTRLKTNETAPWQVLLENMTFTKADFVNDKPWSKSVETYRSVAPLCNYFIPSTLNELVENPEADHTRKGATIVCFDLYPILKKWQSGGPDLLRNTIKAFIKKRPLNEEFLLMSMHGDMNPVNDYRDRNPVNNSFSDWLDFLNETRLVAWYSNNILRSHPKLHAFPIGLQSTKISGFVQVMNQLRTTNIQRTHKLLVNFGTFSNCIREELALKAKAAWPFAVVLPNSIFSSTTPSELFLFDNEASSSASFLTTLSQFRFVVSPPGGGWDCYRHWEAMFFGSIPIILRCGRAYEQLYEDLPVLFVNNYNEIDENLLDRTWQEFKYKTFNLDKLRMSWWMGRVEKAAKLGGCSAR